MHPRVDVTRRAGRAATTTGAAIIATLLLAALVASGASGAAGLQVDELRLDAEAVPGLIGRVTVTNPSSEKIAVTLTPRRWRQGLDGQLHPDLRRAGIVNGVRVTAKSFSLDPGRSRVIEVSLKSTPKQRYLYAALVVRGVASSKKAGLRPSYQIAVALSLRPPAARQIYRLSTSRPRARNRRGGGVLLDTVVRNRGNMVTPPTGTFTVRGAGRTRTVTIPAKTGVLPKGRVRLPAAALRGLRAGRYKVTVKLRQRNGSNGGSATASSSFRLTRGGRVTR